MEKLKEIIQENFHKEKRNNITFLTGAGLSAASGIPTYRSTDGIWVKGTKYHKPEEFGTFSYFSKNQEEVWQFNLFRKGMFQKAQPNDSHKLLAKIEKLIPEEFSIITQNIDGLHQRGGNSGNKVFEIHGNMRTVRCSLECSKAVYLYPKDITIDRIDQDLTDDIWDKLECPKCGAVMRPNILWFDEYYNERLYKVDSTMRIAKNTGILIVIGTSGATTLPLELVKQTLKYGGYVLDVNLEDNNITKLIEGKKRVVSYRTTSDAFLSEFHNILKELM
ncbi:Sir2 family NAD-dependent protein deacetylase [Kordia algicida OT-1]|uniref:protein acetyllysine N-acetyltransferase n=1 Tax=Kordia algicida OT-1 TaxID=391587 RepID=A9DQY7_9FLAO|nr:Sir2 family NAD-dependent protein deacetylase [Kordia algicida]EDP96715.1 Silent information regulator protein Sir2 [Kordia algicida OT-1]